MFDSMQNTPKQDNGKVKEIASKFSETLINNCSPSEIVDIMNATKELVRRHYDIQISERSKAFEELKEISKPIFEQL